MGSSELPARSTAPKDYTIPAKHTKVVKKKAPTNRKPRQAGRTYLNGLMDAKIPVHSDLMTIAKANSLQSPLLCLPAEIRNKIWEYAVGHHQIDIHDYSHVRRWDIKLTHVTSPLNKGINTSSSFVPPTFAVPKVCRQMYVETSSMVYTHNNFGFDNLDTFDRWILNRALGQRRLVTSVDIPFGYYSLYRDGFRKLLRRTFPGITRVRLHIKMAEMNQRMDARTWSWSVPIKEPLEDVKKRFIDEVMKKEGEGLGVGWYNRSITSLSYLRY
ncbi:hypothetical protein BKA58DRAFT_453056 [Alternaria rosae]|uniref:uncharacterized protein n=1 Tax=Alternaria rosae TaxID=1187941 RepID=UPI001E8DDCD2|nr:uncharacterized protein BKA58DRAFT_453056 [Alternaria rosae]KAH6878825.1 hypothetical protein BKA58DRAFT_453056 [Alternaria rosae]